MSEAYEIEDGEGADYEPETDVPPAPHYRGTARPGDRFVCTPDGVFIMLIEGRAGTGVIVATSKCEVTRSVGYATYGVKNPIRWQ